MKTTKKTAKNCQHQWAPLVAQIGKKTIPTLVRVCLKCGELKVGRKTIRISRHRLDMGGLPIRNLPAPVGANDAARRAYVDSMSPSGIMTTRGDLIVRDTSAPVRLPVGVDGQVLTADAAQALGVRWGVPPAGITSGWELIRTGTFTASVDITGLDGNTDRLWMLIVRTRHTAGHTLHLRINGDVGTNYGGTFHKTGISAGVASHDVANQTGVTTISFSSWGGVIIREIFSEIYISPVTGQNRIFIIKSKYLIDTSNFFQINNTNFWANTVDNITTINVLPGIITAGEFWLFRRRV